MGEIKQLFYDTYAFFEILAGNDNYDNYVKSTSAITTRLNLMELHYNLLLRYDETTADNAYNLFAQYIVDVDDQTIREANKFKAQLRRRDVSYIDCIGYIIAKKRGIKFLTGDKAFKDVENVEFVV